MFIETSSGAILSFVLQRGTPDIKRLDGQMLQGPMLNFLVLHALVFKDRPDRGHLICLKIYSKKGLE